MKYSAVIRKVTWSILIAFMVITMWAGAGTTMLAQDLPDLVPILEPGLQSLCCGWRVSTTRPEGTALEFSILTANIGGQDFERPRDPDTGFFLLRQIYEYVMYHDEGGTWVEIDRRRKNTICTIDDTRRGNVYPCIQEHGASHSCGGPQGISRGWADDYFRGLTGQFSIIGDNVGRFKVRAILDPDGDLQRTDIPDSGRDGNPDNNWGEGEFEWDGSTFTPGAQILSFDAPC